MKKLLLLFVLISSVLFTVVPLNEVEAQDSDKPVVMHLFYGEGCPHCAKEIDFLDKKIPEWGEKVEFNKYESYYNSQNAQYFNEALELFQVEQGGVPFLIIGDQYILGYGSDVTTGAEIEALVNYCFENVCEDVVTKYILNDVDIVPSVETEEEKKVEIPKEDVLIDIPLFGSVNLRDFSLPIATILIAFVDGFNPCAMWILIFLITMLVNMKDRKKLYVLGSTFIITSGFVYFLFLSAWFNLFKFIGYVYWIKVIIGIVAIISGIIHLRNGLITKGECHSVDNDKRTSLMDRIKKTISEKNYALAILGMVTLAISVNLVEVVCSAGLPAVYTNLLSSIDLPTVKHYAYILLYVIIFMIDDLAVFFIAIKSLEVVGITRKYSRISGIIGGISILIIGILLIFKPEVLMFGS